MHPCVAGWFAIGVVAACGRVNFAPNFDASVDASSVTGLKLDAHGDQVCLVRPDGTLWCWGRNVYGQLGDGTFARRGIPAPAMIDEVSAVSSGEFTVCAIKRDGSVWCWGRGLQGQVGDGTGMNRPLPTAVTLPGQATHVEMGEYHTCARLSDGTGWCWGDNAQGQLGYDNPVRQLSPQPSPVGGAVAVAIGDELTCALGSSGVVECWGSNIQGELGDGTTVSRSTKRAIVGVTEALTDVAAGCHRHACAVAASGAVWCWGANQFGQLGRGVATAFETVPMPVGGVPAAAQVSVGAFHTCMRSVAGEVWCWGDNQFGQLGIGNRTTQLIPVRVFAIAGEPHEVQASCSNTHLLLADGRLLGWGAAVAVGTGASDDQLIPVEITLP